MFFLKVTWERRAIFLQHHKYLGLLAMWMKWSMGVFVRYVAMVDVQQLRRCGFHQHTDTGMEMFHAKYLGL